MITRKEIPNNLSNAKPVGKFAKWLQSDSQMETFEGDLNRTLIRIKPTHLPAYADKLEFIYKADISNDQDLKIDDCPIAYYWHADNPRRSRLFVNPVFTIFCGEGFVADYKHIPESEIYGAFDYACACEWNYPLTVNDDTGFHLIDNVRPGKYIHRIETYEDFYREVLSSGSFNFPICFSFPHPSVALLFADYEEAIRDAVKDFDNGDRGRELKDQYEQWQDFVSAASDDLREAVSIVGVLKETSAKSVRFVFSGGEELCVPLSSDAYDNILSSFKETDFTDGAYRVYIPFSLQMKAEALGVFDDDCCFDMSRFVGIKYKGKFLYQRPLSKAA